MAVFYRFIRNLEVAIKDREKYSSNLGKRLLGKGWEDHFEVKLRSEACHLDFQKIIPEQAVLKGLLYFENCKDSLVLLFQKFFKPS